MTVPSNNATIPVEKEYQKERKAYEPKTKKVVGPILKPVTASMWQIQISSKYTPLYNSYYVEGINQLYELDCGKNSGWMYSVNGTFPNYGASAYKPKDGDVILWVYTCDLGNDVGNPYQGDEK